MKSFVLATLLAIGAAIAHAQPAVISSVTEAGNVITIRGANFIQARGRFDVLFGTTPLVPTSYAIDTIVAPLPGALTPGSYLISIVPQRYVADDGDTFVFTLAAAGAKGDKGDTGATGPQGVPGATGPQGSPGTTGQRAVTVIQQGHIDAPGDNNYRNLLTASIDVTIVPADLVMSISQTSGVTAYNGNSRCFSSYIWGTGTLFDKQEVITDLRVTSGTSSMPVVAPGTYTVNLLGASNCDLLYVNGSITLMVLNR